MVRTQNAYIVSERNKIWPAGVALQEFIDKDGKMCVIITDEDGNISNHRVKGIIVESEEIK